MSPGCSSSCSPHSAWQELHAQVDAAAHERRGAGLSQQPREDGGGRAQGEGCGLGDSGPSATITAHGLLLCSSSPA